MQYQYLAEKHWPSLRVLTGYRATIGQPQTTMPFQFSFEKKGVIEEGTERLKMSIVAENSHHLFNHDCTIGTIFL